MDMNKSVGYWVRYMFAKEWGSHCVPEWTVVPVSEYRERMVDKYGWDTWADEDWNDEEAHIEHVSNGATHVVRVLLGEHCGMCDGVDLYIRPVPGDVELVSEIDSPDWQGGDWEPSLAWLRELAEPIDA